MHTKCKKFKKGAASFYIVALSTLILVIIATSFATVILSEASRSENDDLSQSAYDSALAGVEDAKLAFANFKRCVESGAKAATSKPSGGGEINCSEIIWWVQHSDCYTVGRILGKIPKSEEKEVLIGETYASNGNEESVMNQAYTCVKIDTNLADYKATLNSGHMSQVVRAGVADNGSNAVERVRISWYAVKNNQAQQWKNFQSNRVTFGAVGDNITNYATPPTLEVQIVQTAEKFSLSDFDKTQTGQTNRGTVYLVPSKEKKTGATANYIGTWKNDKNLIDANQVVKTNNRTASNKPFVVYCNSSDEFWCSVEIELPKAINGSDTARRANNTFMIGISLPYQKPDTEFSIELICGNSNTNCGEKGSQISDSESLVHIKNTQVSIDSTGRANDLYRRVETRIETQDRAFGYGLPYYALQILGDSGASKQMTVAYEKAFYF